MYRLRTLVQYQSDKLGHIDLELLAYLERTGVDQKVIPSSHVYALYEIYKMIELPLKSKRRRRNEELTFLFPVAQIMYHYGCSISDINEQKEVFQLAFDALDSIPKSNDTTDRLFIYPINNEYNVNEVFLSRLQTSSIFPR